MFKTLCTGTLVAEFNENFFKASGKTFEFIQADFNEKICIADENPNEVKPPPKKVGIWIGKVNE